jgi:hypothetical protein
VVVLDVTAEDRSGFVFATERRLYRNIGLDAADRETVLPWEIVAIAERSTALRPGETRRERIALPVPRMPGQTLRLRATLSYRRLPIDEPLPMAEAETAAVMRR